MVSENFVYHIDDDRHASIGIALLAVLAPRTMHAGLRVVTVAGDAFDGGTGTFATPWHFPLSELIPEMRPVPSRRVLDMVPLRWVVSLVVSLPVKRPDASLNWMRLPLPATFTLMQSATLKESMAETLDKTRKEKK